MDTGPNGDEGAWQRVADELDLDPRGPADNLELVAEQLQDRGWSYRAIAEGLGVSKSTVGRWLQAAPAERETSAGSGATAAIAITGVGLLVMVMRRWGHKR